MSRTYEYRSGLASQISAFIAEKRACGCKYEKEAKTFQTLDRFLVEQGINTPVLPELVVEKWIETLCQISSIEWLCRVLPRAYHFISR